MSNLNLTQAHDQWSSRPDDERFWTLEEMHKQTLAYCLNSEEAQMSASDQEADIRRAQELVIAKGKDAMIELLFKKRWTSKRDAASAYDLAAENRHAHGNPDSAWGIVSGLTLLSQKSGHADGRAKMDQAAGKILATCLN
jgi:hypothetical protein